MAIDWVCEIIPIRTLALWKIDWLCESIPIRTLTLWKIEQDTFSKFKYTLKEIVIHCSNMPLWQEAKKKSIEVDHPSKLSFWPERSRCWEWKDWHCAAALLSDSSCELHMQQHLHPQNRHLKGQFLVVSGMVFRFQLLALYKNTTVFCNIVILQ